MNKSVPAPTPDAVWNKRPSRTLTGAAEPGFGYHQSSIELRAGLEISWRPLSALPEDLAAVFLAAEGRGAVVAALAR